MEDAVKLVKAVQSLYEAAGPVVTVLVVAIVFIAPIVWTVLRDRGITKAYNAVIEEKEKQIQRIAADNRQWRAYFFKKEGMVDDEVQKLLDGFPTNAKPLTMSDEESNPRDPK